MDHPPADHPVMGHPWSSARLVALDTSSPLLSVAIGSAENLLAHGDVVASRSSAAIMGLLDGCLDRAGLTPRQIEGLVVLTGPGSFTGLRVGMALAMGLHQALDVPVGTLPTLQVIAAAPRAKPAAAGSSGRLIAAVRGGRDDWRLQDFAQGSPPRPLSDPTSVTSHELIQRSRDTPVIGFGLERLAATADSDDPVGNLLTPPPLATVALSLARQATWDAQRLTRPLYMAPPPADPNAARWSHQRKPGQGP